MSTLSLAYNRFGLGARGDDAAPAGTPEAAHRWILAQFDNYDPRPEPIAAAPARTQVATQLADYLEEPRMARGAARGGEALAPGQNAQAGQGPGRFRQRLALRQQQG